MSKHKVTCRSSETQVLAERLGYAVGILSIVLHIKTLGQLFHVQQLIRSAFGKATE